MQKLLSLLGLGLAAATVGCGGDDGGGADASPAAANPGFVAPAEVTKAWSNASGTATEMGAADFSCLNTASADVAPAAAIIVSGQTNDFQSRAVVGTVDIALFANAEITGSPLETATSGSDGSYTITVPAGAGPRFAYRMRDLTDGARFLDTYLVNQYYAPDQAAQATTLSSVSSDTASALPAFVGASRTPALGVLAGAFRDCAGHEVSGAIATVSAVSCGGKANCAPQHLSGATTYYFSAGRTALPVRLGQRSTTNNNGLFVVIELPPSSSAFLQVWGYPTNAALAAGELQLLGEIPAPVLADSVITASMEPFRD